MDAPVYLLRGMTAGVLRLLYEILFPYAADGAYPIVGDILEGGAGGDSSVGVAYRGVINPVAYFTSVFFHLFIIFITVPERPGRGAPQGLTSGILS